MSADKKKYKIMSYLLIFLTIKNPNSAKGSIGNVAIHQLADPPKPCDVNTTAIATGLNICFLNNAKIYFDEMESMDAHTARAKYPLSEKETSGEIIRMSMSAVI